MAAYLQPLCISWEALVLVSGITRAIAMERALKFADNGITASMLAAMVFWGPIGCFIVGFVLDFLFAIFVLELHLISTRRFGFDVIGVAEIRKWIYAPGPESLPPVDGENRWSAMWRGIKNLHRAFTRRLKRAARPILGSYWLMILVGTMISFLESDYVTLFLRKEGEGRLSVLIRVTLPAVAWSIGIWTCIYWAAVQGFGWAIQLVS